MKNVIVLSLLLAVGTSTASAQFVFGVKPGVTANSGQFGVKVGSLVLLGGLEFLRTTATTDESGTRLNYVYSSSPPFGSYQIEPFKDQTEVSADIYVPFVGAKMPFADTEAGKAVAYVTAFIAKPILTSKSSTNGREDEDVAKLAENLSLWAFQAGFGTEYYFSDSFSIGGEFGVRMLLATYEEENSRTQSVYETGRMRTYTTTSKYNLDLGAGITYSALCLNFYF